MTVVRSTISFTEENWEKLKDMKNRSRFVNHAVKYFLKLETHLEKKEIEFIEKQYEKYLETGESYTLDEVFE